MKFFSECLLSVFLGGGVRLCSCLGERKGIISAGEEFVGGSVPGRSGCKSSKAIEGGFSGQLSWDVAWVKEEGGGVTLDGLTVWSIL